MSRSEEMRAPTVHRRRIAAFLLALLTPGLGHAAIWRTRRGLAWCAAHVAAAGILFFTLNSALEWAWLALVLAGANLLASAFDTLRCPRPEGLPRWRFVVLAGVIAFVGLGLLAEVGRPRLEAYLIKGNAMFPSVIEGDRVIVAKSPQEYEVGDVVLVSVPSRPGALAPKRIIALGGDGVEFRGGQLEVNGQPVPRGRASETATGVIPSLGSAIWEEELRGRKFFTASSEPPGISARSKKTAVPPGQVFLLGDNRDQSQDSRFWGPLPLESIVGRVSFIWWSSDAAGIRWRRVNSKVR